MMIKALLFDFDGVILESADIKTAAYRALFKGEDSNKVEEFIDYHIQNAGISRFVKVRYFYEKILGIKITDKKKGVNRLF